MVIITNTWTTFGLKHTDTQSEVTRKLNRKNIDLLEVPHSVYVIRLANKFIIEYSNEKLSPVIYIGQGKLRDRLNTHRGWLAKLQALLPQAEIEVKVCFPRESDGKPLHKEYEAHLLLQFKSQFGQLPLRNRKQQLNDGGKNFSVEGRQQALGHGIGKKYTWSIKPLKEKVPFTKYKVK